MSRPVFPFSAPDISLLARSLTKQWQAETTAPSHVQMLNMLARAIGFQNFQHFRDSTDSTAADALPSTDDLAAGHAPATAFHKQTTNITADNAHRLLRHFDDGGRLMRWPGKYSEQLPCLWTIWSRIPANHTMSEPDVNGYIRAGEALGDHVLLRRELISYGLLQRTMDGRVYQRVEHTIPAELHTFVEAVLARGQA